MVPATWPPSAENEGRLMAYVQKHGERGLQAAVSGGQCEFADGLFYGGVRPAWSNSVLRRILREQCANATTLGWIDFHTGLGPRGHGEKIYAGRNKARELERARAWWGSDVTSIYDESSSSAELTGLMFNATYDECPGVECVGIGLEFGTLPLPAMLQALRADHWLHVHPEAAPALRTAIQQQMRDAFYIDANDWK